MAELALAATVIAVLQLTGSVISACYDYTAAAKGGSWELSRVSRELSGLRDVLQALEPLAEQADIARSTPGTKPLALAMLNVPGGLLEQCSSESQQLEGKLKTPSWCDGFGPRRKALIQVLRWPMKEDDTNKALINIGRLKVTLALAITADQATLALEIKNLSLSTQDIVLDSQRDFTFVKQTATTINKDTCSTRLIALDMQAQLQSVRLDSRRQSIHQWLSAPDASTNDNRACRTRQNNTGLGFIHSDTFTRWKTDRIMLWLHGKPGCGKSLLSSTIIEDLQGMRRMNSVAVAYFYFDFNDIQKRKPDNMIRSLIIQLSGQCQKSPEVLEYLYSACDQGSRQPNVGNLMKTLRSIALGLSHTYVTLDALDECSDTQELLTWIEEINRWEKANVHLLLTSRRHDDIEEIIELLTRPEDQIGIQSATVDADISLYVQERLQKDSRLKRWRGKPEVQEEIRATIMCKADGMLVFRAILRSL